MKVQHKRSGNIAEVISNDGKKVVVKDVVKNEATELAISTYKRWWKKIDDEPDEQTKKAIEVVKEMPAEKVVETVEKVIKKEKAKKALIDDNKCGDGTPLAEVGKEILEQAKKKAQQAKKKTVKSGSNEKKNNTTTKKHTKQKTAGDVENLKLVNSIVDTINTIANKYNFSVDSKCRNEVFYKLSDSSYLFKIAIKRKWVVLYTKSQIVDSIGGYNISNTNFNANYKFDTVNKELVKKIVSACVDYNKAKKKAKTTKKEEK